MTTPEPLWDADKVVDRLSLYTWQSDPKEDNDFVTVGVAVFVAMQMQADYEAELATARARVAELEAQLISVSKELVSTSNREPSGCRYYRGFSDGFAHAEARIEELEAQLAGDLP